MDMAEKTRFAPAERLDAAGIRSENELVASAAYVREMINAMPWVVAVLNRHRQMIFINEAFAELLSIEGVSDVLGMRPGEAVDCVHAVEEPGGCGTSESCRYCDAVCAILESERTGRPAHGECSITTGGVGGGALDLSVNATPFEVEGRSFTLFTMVDVSDEKRRRNLERIFFHDILNTVTLLNGLVGSLPGYDATELHEEIAYIVRVSESLVEDVIAQRELADAESGDLVVSPSEINSMDLLREVAGQASRHRVARGRTVEVAAGGPEFTFATDRKLLRRILLNMLKNALEAAREGGKVEVGAAAGPDTVSFSVSGPGYMPREVQLRVFSRSFSTRGPDRGLGTYGMKLLAERYLGGRVYFTSSEEEGTTFTVEIPRELPADRR